MCRAVSVCQPVSSLALVSVAGGPSVPAHFHPALRYFHGQNPYLPSHQYVPTYRYLIHLFPLSARMRAILDGSWSIK